MADASPQTRPSDPVDLRHRLASTGRRRHRSRAAALLVLASLTIAGGLGMSMRAASDPPASRRTTTTWRSPLRSDRMSSAPSITTTTLACRLQIEDPAADLDGDGCREALVVGEGLVVARDRRFSVGAADDELAFGDWDCDGSDTAALLRPSTGQVWIFARWAEPELEVRGELVGTVGGATTVVSVDIDGDGCDDLAVLTPMGRQIVRMGSPS